MVRPRSVTVIASLFLGNGILAVATLLDALQRGEAGPSLALLHLVIAPGLLRGHRVAHLAAIASLCLAVFGLVPSVWGLLLVGWDASIPLRVGPWVVPAIPGALMIVLMSGTLIGVVWALLVLDQPEVRTYFRVRRSRTAQIDAPAA